MQIQHQSNSEFTSGTVGLALVVMNRILFLLWQPLVLNEGQLQCLQSIRVIVNKLAVSLVICNQVSSSTICVRFGHADASGVGRETT